MHIFNCVIIDEEGDENLNKPAVYRFTQLAFKLEDVTCFYMITLETEKRDIECLTVSTSTDTFTIIENFNVFYMMVEQAQKGDYFINTNQN
jgi:hypothetical protein